MLSRRNNKRYFNLHNYNMVYLGGLMWIHSIYNNYVNYNGNHNFMKKYQ